jgi:hypothetical protein
MIVIEVGIRGGSIHIVQYDRPPTIYLDHWALLTVSQSKELSDSLIEAVKTRGGTFALSWINLFEYSKISDKRQAELAESLVDGMLPNVFLIEADIARVIEKEDMIRRGELRAPPHSDEVFLKILISHNPQSIKPISVQGLFASVQNDSLSKELDSLADEIVKSIKSYPTGSESVIRRLAINTDDESIKGLQHHTRYVFRALVHSIRADKGDKLTRNDAIDLLHTVVPLSYCDFVLLDKYWETHVQRMKNQFERLGMNIRMARVFSGSKKSGGVRSLLDSLGKEPL